MENPTKHAPLHGFSVGTLLLLTAVVAIGAAAVRTIIVTPRVEISSNRASIAAIHIDQGETALRGVAGCLIGLLVGIRLGAMRPRPLVGVLFGVFIGGIIGALAGGVLADPRNLSLAVSGSALLILFGVGMRALSSPH